MCGILAYTGFREAEPVLLDGLRRLEYRGYDSAGLVTLTGPRLHVRKRAGRLANLAGLLDQMPAPGCHGIAHTRWATHGDASDANAHPHVGGNGQVAVVHNGVIENHEALRDQLLTEGYVFHSDTDTEVLAHLIASFLNGDLVEAVRKALACVKGTYGLAVISPEQPDVIVGACLGSPLLLGIGQDEVYLTSDAAVLAGGAEDVVYLKDNQLCVLTREMWQVLDRHCTPILALVQRLDAQPGEADKGTFEHFLLKEIYDQPEALENALRGRLNADEGLAHFGGLNLDAQQLRSIDRIVLTGCGTSYHAALIGEYLFEHFARLPVEVEYASEFRYRNAPLQANTLVIAVTQSGETADTLAAVREAKRKGLPTLAICNVVGSTIAREADGGIYLHAGEELGAASTKAFTSQVLVLALLALHFGRLRDMSSLQGYRLVQELQALPDLVRRTLTCHAAVRRIAQKYHDVGRFVFLGRQYLYPVALEGALKLEEIGSLHAEGYSAAERKRGPVARVDETTPSVFLVPRGAAFDKVLSNLHEIKAQGAPVVAIATEGDEEVASQVDDVIFIPDAPEYLQPLLAAVPLQLLAYHVALLRGGDVDRPRNVAGSVSVE